MLQKNLSKNPFYEKVNMLKKGPFVLESFVIVGSCDYDHTFATLTHHIKHLKKMKLPILGLGSRMYLKLSSYVGYTHWGVYCTCLRTLFYWDHASKSCTFIFINTSIIKRTHKFIVA
jgi:hypothetical protein